MGSVMIVFVFILFAIIILAVKGGRSSSHAQRPHNHTNMWGGDQQRSLDSSTTDFSTHDNGSHTHHNHHHNGHHDHSHHGGHHHGGHDSGGFGGGDAGGGGHH